MGSKSPHHTNTDVFNAIAHPVRREILDQLSDSDLTVKHLAGRFEMSRPAISQHLAVLLEVGLVSMHEAGRENFYHLEPERLQEVETWVRHFERFWNKKLDKLGEFLKRKAGDAS